MFDLQQQLDNPVRCACHAQGTTVPVIVIDGFNEPYFDGRNLNITVGAGWLIENGLDS